MRQLSLFWEDFAHGSTIVWPPTCSALSAALGLALSANAASVTPQVRVNFDGSLAGTAYTLGDGELDNSFTFAGNGSVSISGGVADIPGDVDGTQSVSCSAARILPSSRALELSLRSRIGSLRRCVCPDVPAADQPTNPQPGTTINHVWTCRGTRSFATTDLGTIRRLSTLGTTAPRTTPSLRSLLRISPTGEFTHVALVWNGRDQHPRGISQRRVARVGCDGSPRSTCRAQTSATASFRGS